MPIACENAFSTSHQEKSFSMFPSQLLVFRRLMAQTAAIQGAGMNFPLASFVGRNDQITRRVNGGVVVHRIANDRDVGLSCDGLRVGCI